MKPLKSYILDDAATRGVSTARSDVQNPRPVDSGVYGRARVGHGWHCLELGGGNGSIAEWLCGVVGSSGSMAAVDINTVLLELVPAQNLAVRQLDVRAGQLPANSYDLVTCRAVLHQISEHAAPVLEQMAAAVKPGEWLLVQEPDFHLAPTTEPAAWAATRSALIEWGRANGVDWLIGRTLPSMVSKLGLGQPQAKTDVQNIRGTDRGSLHFKLFFAEVRDRVIDSGRLDAATLDAATKLLDDPDYWTQCWMMTAVWARKALA